MVLGISSGIRDGLVDFGGFQVDFVVFLGVLVVWWISGGFLVCFSWIFLLWDVSGRIQIGLLDFWWILWFWDVSGVVEFEVFWCHKSSITPP